MDKSIHSREYGRFINLLKDARKGAGLTQVELADRLGEHQSFVSKFESGERRIDVVELKQICEAIGLEFHRFIEELFPPD